ncbi:MAG: hypothetical protein LBG97_05345, partial [Coriobacteriales bacterium]|nr:hypothetical protein [Coriobacteriales bacterium]
SETASEAATESASPLTTDVVIEFQLSEAVADAAAGEAAADAAAGEAVTGATAAEDVAAAEDAAAGEAAAEAAAGEAAAEDVATEDVTVAEAATEATATGAADPQINSTINLTNEENEDEPTGFKLKTAEDLDDDESAESSLIDKLDSDTSMKLRGNIDSSEQFYVGGSYWTNVRFDQIGGKYFGGVYDYDTWSLTGSIYGKPFKGVAECCEPNVPSQGAYFTVTNVEFVCNSIYLHENGQVDIWLHLKYGKFYLERQDCKIKGGSILITYTQPKDDARIAKLSADPITDKLPSHYRLDDGEFQIADKNYNVIATLTTTGDKGTTADGRRYCFTPWTANILTVSETYYWRESRAPTGFINSHPQWESFVAKAPDSVFYCYDEPLKGSLAIVKSSGNPSISNNNPCYSLAGAVFGVYDTKENAKAAGNAGLVGKITTDANGKGQLDNLFFGTYYLSEISAPLGYMPARDKDGKPTVFTIDVSASNTCPVLNVSNMPLSDTIDMLVQKIDSVTNKAFGKDDQNGSLLAGAEFTLRYWSGYYDSVFAAEASGAPMRTWVLSTQIGGKAQLSDGCLVRGDALYKNDKGLPCMPLGTLIVQETKAPVGYLLPNPNPVFVKKIAMDATKIAVSHVNTIKVNEQPHIAKVRKLDAQTGDPLEKTEFVLYKEEAPNTGVWHELARKITDNNGNCEFMPVSVGYYKLVELKATPGYQLPEMSGSAKEQFFVIDENTDVVELTFKDTKLTEIEVEKRDIDDDTPIADTEFSIYCYPVNILDGMIVDDTSTIKADDTAWKRVSECYAYDKQGSVVKIDAETQYTTPISDRLSTNSDGKLVFKDLPFGYYKLEESKPNPLYAPIDETKANVRMLGLQRTTTNEAQVFTNKLIQISVEVYKQTIALTSSALDASSVGATNNVGDEQYIYRFGARSNANVRADEFVVTDDLLAATKLGYRMTTLWTGTALKDLDHDNLVAVLYKTNLTSEAETPDFKYHPLSANPNNPNNPEKNMQTSALGGWRVWAEQLPTTTSTRLDVSDLCLSEQEYIIGIKAVYGGVEKDFFTGNGWHTQADPHTVKSLKSPTETDASMTNDLATVRIHPSAEKAAADVDDWMYAVVATEALGLVDAEGNETVMRGSVRADIARNWANGAAVLTDLDIDMVETRVIDYFEVPSKSWGLTQNSENPNSDIPNKPNEPDVPNKPDEPDLGDDEPGKKTPPPDSGDNSTPGFPLTGDDAFIVAGFVLSLVAIGLVFVLTSCKYRQVRQKGRK